MKNNPKKQKIHFFKNLIKHIKVNYTEKCKLQFTYTQLSNFCLKLELIIIANIFIIIGLLIGLIISLT